MSEKLILPRMSEGEWAGLVTGGEVGLMEE